MASYTANSGRGMSPPDSFFSLFGLQDVELLPGGRYALVVRKENHIELWNVHATTPLWTRFCGRHAVRIMEMVEAVIRVNLGTGASDELFHFQLPDRLSLKERVLGMSGDLLALAVYWCTDPTDFTTDDCEQSEQLSAKGQKLSVNKNKFCPYPRTSEFKKTCSNMFWIMNEDMLTSVHVKYGIQAMRIECVPEVPPRNPCHLNHVHWQLTDASNEASGKSQKRLDPKIPDLAVSVHVFLHQFRLPQDQNFCFWSASVRIPDQTFWHEKGLCAMPQQPRLTLHPRYPVKALMDIMFISQFDYSRISISASYLDSVFAVKFRLCRSEHPAQPRILYSTYAILLINWQQQQYIFIWHPSAPSLSPFTPNITLFPGHLIFTMTCNEVFVYPGTSFASCWRPLTSMVFDDLVDWRSKDVHPAVITRLEDLPIAGPIEKAWPAELTLYQSPLRRDSYKLIVFYSGSTTKHKFPQSFFRVMVTYRFSVVPDTGALARWERTSAVPAGVTIHHRGPLISYTGYGSEYASSATTVVKLRCPSPVDDTARVVLETDEPFCIRVSGYSHACLRLRDGTLVLSYYV
ncbi:hypothetical protein DFH07DRAFT_782193 [Mycena maculata]|uniref:Uncharacterized protein n=1 Tax=Mycena maculata TaxID=230809 RepID=A0AAD7MSB1_9AGAR|nr:hypothetical protein DFH07DRAFT_782193 [Mycena maculata]